MSAAAAGSALSFMGTMAAQAATTEPAAPTVTAAPAAVTASGALLEVDVWTTYSGGGSLAANMNACRAALNTDCFGLQGGQALGQLDPLVVTDQLDESLGLSFGDDATLPAPVSPSDEVIQVWNGAGIVLFTGPGPSAAADVASGGPMYDVATGTDPTGPAFDGYVDYDDYYASGHDADHAGDDDDNTRYGNYQAKYY